MSKPHLKAVIFDIGGVVVKSPLLAIAAYEREHNLPKDFINVSISRRGDQGAWQRFERGEIPLLQFYREFSQDLSDAENGSRWYREYCVAKKIPCSPLPNPLNIDGRELFGRMMRESVETDPDIVEAIHRIRKHGRHRVIALTNNFSKEMPAEMATSEMAFLGWLAPDGSLTQNRLRMLFDDFIDSSETGMRKPDPAFYLYACRRNGIQPSEVIFLDDIGQNLRAAKNLGMETIHVKVGQTMESLKELGDKLGISLTEKGKL